jgi:hypothetical protein
MVFYNRLQKVRVGSARFVGTLASSEHLNQQSFERNSKTKLKKGATSQDSPHIT